MARIDPAQAREIVNGIIDDLGDRRGLRQAWDAIDVDIRQEIRDRWDAIVANGGGAEGQSKPPAQAAKPVEKRCGVCANWNLCDKTKNGVRPCSHDFGYFKPDGPPWENCRFWKPKEKKP